MFDNLELPIEMSDYLISITPLLGISGTMDEYNLYSFNKYFSISDNRLVILFSTIDIPEKMTINVLRKGEDKKIIAVHKKEKINQKFLKESRLYFLPYYIHSVISFETKLEKIIYTKDNENLAIFKIDSAVGVAGLDPTFNDKVTLAKTLEVMSMSAVDNYVIERKLENY